MSGTQVTSRTVYDSYGNAVFTWAAGNRCASVQYDGDFEQLPMLETVYVGEPTGAVQGETCGDHQLTSQANYDRGLQAMVDVVDINGGMTLVDYDPLGRMSAMWAPNPDTAGASTLPSLKVEYHLPDETGRPVSRLVSYTQDGADHTVDAYHVSYAYIDGLGRTIATLSEADLDDDGFEWVVQGLTDYDKKGAERRKYLAWPYTGDPLAYELSAASPAKYGQQRYDAFGRAIQTMGLDGTVTLHTKYHALSADAWDAEDLGPGPHQGTYASELKDGHGRVIETTERVKNGTGIEARYVRMAYLPTGQPTQIRREGPGAPVIRTMDYDSLGRMVSNYGWHYQYDSAGDLVATSDPRGCGQVFAYDTSGRLESEDYIPCQPHHAAYTTAAEVTYLYDTNPADASEAFKEPSDPELGLQDCRNLNFTKGRLVAVTDRAQQSYTCYDGRGRTIEVAKQLADPSGNIGGRWYNRRAAYDGADRPTFESTGAEVLEPGQTSKVHTSYTKRGKVWQVASSYGLLVDHVRRDADGLVEEIEYGDPTALKTAFTYDDLRRLRNLTTYRSALTGWTPNDDTKQLLLQDEQFTYDRVGNPVEIRDWRDPSEWQAGAKPVSRKMQYDSLYRLSRIDYQYPESGADLWENPYKAELDDDTRPQPSPHADFTGERRVQWQTYAYDWLGNTESTHDDLEAFYDRSLGMVENDGYKLQSAENDASSTRHGNLGTTYDAAGNLTALDVARTGPCRPAGKCNEQHFRYEWDEVGRLVRARRWDMQNPDAVPPPAADAELSITYDASDQRVRKTSGVEHTLYIFASLELRGAEYGGLDYVRDSATEVAFLFANGVRLARVVHTDAPALGEPSAHVFLELGDHLGSTSVVMDLGTGELVQRSTAYAYGAPESSYRPGRWKEFREDYRFTGKEDDVEVGLIYFGKRYLNPLLQRWISADPLAIHAPGQADLNLYAYVHGKVLVAVDPVGLSCEEPDPTPTVDAYASWLRTAGWKGPIHDSSTLSRRGWGLAGASKPGLRPNEGGYFSKPSTGGTVRFNTGVTTPVHQGVSRPISDIVDVDAFSFHSSTMYEEYAQTVSWDRLKIPNSSTWKSILHEYSTVKVDVGGVWRPVSGESLERLADEAIGDYVRMRVHVWTKYRILAEKLRTSGSVTFREDTHGMLRYGDTAAPSTLGAEVKVTSEAELAKHYNRAQSLVAGTEAGYTETRSGMGASTQGIQPEAQRFADQQVLNNSISGNYSADIGSAGPKSGGP